MTSREEFEGERMPRAEELEPRPQEPPGIESEMSPEPDFGLKTYQGNGRLKGKVAIVTGGDSGIGRAVCLAFAREGANVVCSYLDEHKDAKVTEKAVTDSGQECILISGDICSPEHCQNIIHTCMDKFGKIDILVNNAAFQGKAVESFRHIEHSRLMHTFETNIIAMFNLCKYAVGRIGKGGAIINVGSIQAYDPSYSILDYASTKGAITAFTKGLARELFSKGIRVNCIAPGPVWTPLVVASFPPEKLEKFGKNYPIVRPSQPVEISPAFVFLASDESSYISGEILGVTGGEPLA